MTMRLGEITTVIFRIKTGVPDGVRVATTESARDYAVKSGLIPKEATTILVSSINRKARQLGLTVTRS